MAALAIRARDALAGRLRELVPAARLAPGATHTLRFADALARSVAAGDAAWAHAQLAARAKGELRPSRAGLVQAHAAWSSTGFVVSAFAPWRREPATLPLAGLGPFTGLRLEERLHIPHGGGTPNLDVALDAPDGLVGVEAKLTEHLAPARARAWKAAYRRPAMAAALGGGWRETFAALLDGAWRPRFLDAGQLVRHALSLRGAGHLVYLWWEPLDAWPEVAEHRAEVAEMLARVGPSAPSLHAVPFGELLDAWAPVRSHHAAALSERYGVALGAP